MRKGRKQQLMKLAQVDARPERPKYKVKRDSLREGKWTGGVVGNVGVHTRE
jgi:hypothetical protein